MKSLVAATCLVVCSASAWSATQTFAKSGVINGLDGYGYEMTATWNASDDLFHVVTRSESQFKEAHPIASWDYDGFLNLSILLQPVRPLTLEKFDLEATVTLKVINTTTGEPALLPGGITIFGSHGSSTGFAAVPTEQVALRFSTSKLVREIDFTNNSPSDMTVHSKVSFNGGHYLAVSQDPDCASFSCMPAFHDRLLGEVGLHYSLRTPEVPEPATYALFLSAFPAILFAARRRRGA